MRIAKESQKRMLDKKNEARHATPTTTRMTNMMCICIPHVYNHAMPTSHLARRLLPLAAASNGLESPKQDFHQCTVSCDRHQSAGLCVTAVSLLGVAQGLYHRHSATT